MNTPIYSASTPTYIKPPQSLSEQSTIINTPSTQSTFIKTPSNLSQQPDAMDTPSRQSTLEFDPSIHSIHPSNSQSFKPEARHDWPMPPSAFPTPARRRHLWLTITSVVTALVLIIASIVIVYARSSSEHPGPKTVTATSITQASTAC